MQDELQRAADGDARPSNNPGTVMVFIESYRVLMTTSGTDLFRRSTLCRHIASGPRVPAYALVDAKGQGLAVLTDGAISVRIS